jgi:hypothetical protein
MTLLLEAREERVAPAERPIVPEYEIVVVPPFEWDDAKVTACYRNVSELIAMHGGTHCYGWALAEYGPCRLCESSAPAPLFRRWINHVVWRDAHGLLWDPSPHVAVQDPSLCKFLPTDFVVDPQATFTILPDGNWITQHARYVPVRPEGIPVTDLLTRAQHSTGEERSRLLCDALYALQPLGFAPDSWHLEVIGERTGNIWLTAK